MFILNKGIIGVYINDFKVAMIDKPGTVIGEISLLLGEKRTATLKAVNQVVLSVIKKENLPDFHKNHQDVFFQIGETLSQRLYNNFDLIQKIDEQIHEKPIEKVGGFLTIDRAKLKLNELKSELNTLYNTKRYEQLPELINLAEGS